MKGSIDLCKLIVENLPGGVWVSDENDFIIYANESMCVIAGVPCSEIIGKSVKRDFSNETVDEFSKHYLKVKASLTPGEYESRVKTQGGKDTIQRGWLIPLIEEGRFSGMIVTVEDITEKGILKKKLEDYQQNLERMVTERTKELEEKNEKLNKFNKLFVEREFRIKELRDKVKELESMLKEGGSDERK
ncbi:MAG: PAS domain-containing protein [Candidatus Delongbacteria bacterium]|jgi:PAS domain S-box-containing protein|nr:PAS domain-containing protein [Candidatus Delongbacteria bacterium]